MLAIWPQNGTRVQKYVSNVLVHFEWSLDNVSATVGAA